MEPESTFVRTESGIELHTVSSIDLDLLLVVFPGHSELNDTLGDGGDLKCFSVFGVLLEEGGILEGGGQLCVHVLRSIAIQSEGNL